jgi:hypothetical protein
MWPIEEADCPIDTKDLLSETRRLKLVRQDVGIP